MYFIISIFNYFGMALDILAYPVDILLACVHINNKLYQAHCCDLRKQTDI